MRLTCRRRGRSRRTKRYKGGNTGNTKTIPHTWKSRLLASRKYVMPALKVAAIATVAAAGFGTGAYIGHKINETRRAATNKKNEEERIRRNREDENRANTENARIQRDAERAQRQKDAENAQKQKDAENAQKQKDAENAQKQKDAKNDDILKDFLANIAAKNAIDEETKKRRKQEEAENDAQARRQSENNRKSKTKEGTYGTDFGIKNPRNPLNNPFPESEPKPKPKSNTNFWEDFRKDPNFWEKFGNNSQKQYQTPPPRQHQYQQPPPRQHYHQSSSHPKTASILSPAGIRERVERVKTSIQNRKENTARHDDNYTILGINKGASKTELKKAYYATALVCHPDKSGSDTKELAALVNSAYAYLSGIIRGGRYKRKQRQTNKNKT